MVDISDTPFGTGGPKITRPPFIPSARSNVNLVDIITSTRNPSTGKFFQSKAAFDAFTEAEIGTSIGKKDGPKALQLLNKINKQGGGKGYVPISEAYKQMEESTLKTKNPKIKKAEGIKLANQLTSIQNEANKKFGKATTGPKVTWMKDALKNAGITTKNVLKLGMKSILPALGPIGAILSVGMSKEAETGELSPELQEEQQKYGAQDRMNRAGGGMININNMTRPLGYKEAGEVGVRERIYNWLAPNEKMSDEELRLQGINPDSVLPEEIPEAKGRPEGVLQGIFGELFGGRGAEGSELGDMLDTYIPILKTKIIKLEADGLDATGEKNWLEYYEDLRRRQD